MACFITSENQYSTSSKVTKIASRSFSNGSYNSHLSRQRQNTKSWYEIKILELKKLSQNWQDTEVNPPNNISLYWASEALEVLRKIDFPCDRIAASVDEGVCISFVSKKNKNKYADIEFFNNSEIIAAKSDRVLPPKIWEISVGEIENTLEEIREYIEL